MPNGTSRFIPHHKNPDRKAVGAGFINFNFSQKGSVRLGEDNYMKERVQVAGDIYRPVRGWSDEDLKTLKENENKSK